MQEQIAGLTVSSVNKIVEGVVVAVECNLVVPLQVCMKPLLASCRKTGDPSRYGVNPLAKRRTLSYESLSRHCIATVAKFPV